MHNPFITGTLEVALQSLIRFRVLSSARLFSDAYKVSEEEILLACDDDAYLLKNKTLSLNDRNDVSLKDDSEMFEHFCMEKTQIDSKTEVLKSEFKKDLLIFGG